MTLTEMMVTLTGEGLMSKNTGARRPSHEAIARLAYYLFEERGREGGRDLEDWISAERQLTRRTRNDLVRSGTLAD